MKLMSQLIWFVLTLITVFLESCILGKPDSVQKNASPGPNMTWARKSSPNHHYGIISVVGLRPLLVAGVSATTV